MYLQNTCLEVFSAVLQGSLKNIVLQFEEKGAAGEKNTNSKFQNKKNDFRGGPDGKKKLGVKKIRGVKKLLARG